MDDDTKVGFFFVLMVVLAIVGNLAMLAGAVWVVVLVLRLMGVIQ